jgi:hypothetical protein
MPAISCTTNRERHQGDLQRKGAAGSLGSPAAIAPFLGSRFPIGASAVMLMQLTFAASISPIVVSIAPKKLARHGAAAP